MIEEETESSSFKEQLFKTGMLTCLGVASFYFNNVYGTKKPVIQKQTKKRKFNTPINNTCTSNTIGNSGFIM